MPVVPAGRAMRPGRSANCPLKPMPDPRRTAAVRRLMPLLGSAVVAVCLPAKAADLSGSASRAAATARRPAPPAVKFDPAVVPAGGAGCCSVNDGSGQARQAGFHHAHAHGCRDGMCVPSCPVRPGQFGYYGTQWRRWPGQGVIQASAAEGATPVAPPKSAVPGAEEESPVPRDGAANPASEADRHDDDQAAPPSPSDEPSEPLPLDAGAEANPQPLRQRPPAPRRDAATINTAGPWSRMVAAASLPPGYEPPLFADEPGPPDSQ